VRFNRGLLNWGVFLIVLAAVPLAVQLGYLSAADARALLQWWPLLLITIGIGLLLRFTPFDALGGVLTAATVGLLLGALLAGGVGAVSTACGPGNPAAGSLETRSGTFAGESAQVDLELTCVDLELDRQPGTEWTVSTRQSGGSSPTIEASPDRLTLKTDAGPFFGGSGRNWDVIVPQAPDLSLGLTLNASAARIDLGGGELSSVGATLNASDMHMDLGGALADGASLGFTLNAASASLSLPATSLTGSMTLNAASLTLCTPPDAGLRIRYNSTLSSENFAAAGLTASGEVWQTPGYEQATVRDELSISSNVSSITLHRTGGCP
jgi:hypothetical protein